MEHPDPRNRRFGDKRFKKLGKSHAVADVATVVCKILRDEVDFARSLELEELRLAHYFVTRERAVFAAHQRNCAERAPVIATFADLEITDVREVAGVNANARMECFRGRADYAPLCQFLREASGFGRAEKEIHFGECVGELGLVPLDHAPDTDYCLARTVGFVSRGLDHRI